MISCYKGHYQVVRYLLQTGADPNDKALCGASALHFSAEIGNVPIVQCLLEHGARMEANEHGKVSTTNSEGIQHAFNQLAKEFEEELDLHFKSYNQLIKESRNKIDI